MVVWCLSGGKRSKVENLRGQIKEVGGVNCLIDGWMDV